MKILEIKKVNPFILNEHIVDDVKETDIPLDKNNFLIHPDDMMHKYYTDTKPPLHNYLSRVMFDKYEDTHINANHLLSYLVEKKRYINQQDINKVHYRMQKDFDLNKSIEVILEYVLFKSKGKVYLGISSVLYNINMRGHVFGLPFVQFSYFQVKTKKNKENSFESIYMDYMVNRRFVYNVEYEVEKMLEIHNGEFYIRNYDFLNDKTIELIDKNYEPIVTNKKFGLTIYKEVKPYMKEVKGFDYHEDVIWNHLLKEESSLSLFQLFFKNLMTYSVDIHHKDYKEQCLSFLNNYLCHSKEMTDDKLDYLSDMLDIYIYKQMNNNNTK